MAGAQLGFPWSQAPGDGAAIEIAAGVLWMRLPMPHPPGHINIYAFDEGDGWAVIDTGYGVAGMKERWQTLLDGPLAAKPVTRLLCSHHHPDHIGLAGWFQTEHGAELLMSRLSWHMARMRVLDVQPQATPEDIAFWIAAGMAPEVLAKRRVDRPMNYCDMVAPMPMGFTRLHEGAPLRLGGRDWDVRMAHGHAAGMVTLFSRDDNLVIGADHLLPGPAASISVYSTEPDADPVSEWFDSCARLAEIARDDQLVLPGHGLPFTGAPLRLARMVTSRRDKLDRLLAHVSSPKTACDCFAPLFKSPVSGPMYGFAMVEAVAHLNHLLAQGLVTRTRREDGAWLWQAKEAADG